MINIVSTLIGKIILVILLSVMGIITGDKYFEWQKDHNKVISPPPATTTINNTPVIYIIRHPETLKSSKL